MMKSIFFGIVTLMFAAIITHQEQASAEITDTNPPGSNKKNVEIGDWNYNAEACSGKLKEQIKMEFDASIFYMQCAAHFAQYNVNLPGFEKFFFNAASEEREHGIKLIEYALMRGVYPQTNTSSLNFKQPSCTAGGNGNLSSLVALKAALEKEQEVTKSIRELIKKCEGDQNDYHLVDYLTGEFLEEQHQGQRELAEKIAMLEKIMKGNPKLGEFIFDKQNM